MNMKQFAAISAINARVLAEYGNVTASDAKNHGAACNSMFNSVHAMRDFADKLDAIAEAPHRDDTNQLARIYAVYARVSATMTESYAFKVANDVRADQGLAAAYGDDVFHAAAHNLRAFAGELSRMHGDYTHDDPEER